MADEDVMTDDTPQETPSEDGVPVDDESETPSDDTTDEPEADEPDEGESPLDTDETDPTTPPEGDDEDDAAWRNFKAKFGHLKSDRDQRAAMGKAFWEKTRYASQVRKENEELKQRLARLEATPEKPPQPDEPQQPPPELARIEQRIQVLYAKDQALVKQQNEQLISLSDVDKQVAVIEDRMKDAEGEDYQKAILAQRLEIAKTKRESILSRWADLTDRRENIAVEMEQRLTDRDWTQRFLADKANREAAERRAEEQFQAEFPKHVDSLIEGAADELGAPAEEKLRKGLWRSVNRALMVDLWQLGDKGLTEANVPGMVRALVKEYLEERDLLGRQKFKERSAAKLKVAGREAGKPAPVPASRKAPVPPSLLSTGDLPPAMLRARKILTEKYGG